MKVFSNLLEDWFVNTPELWKTRKNRTLFKIEKKTVGEDWTEYQLLSMGKPGVTFRDMESGKGKFPESFESYQTGIPGDLIFCLYDIDETPRTVGYSDISGMITPSYTIVKCFPGINPKFLYYMYSTLDDNKVLKPYYTGLRNSIRPETFLNIELKIPPLEIQNNVVNFLDNKIGLINKLINKEKERIKSLEELKYSLSYEHVTGKNILD